MPKKETKMKKTFWLFRVDKNNSPCEKVRIAKRPPQLTSLLPEHEMSQSFELPYLSMSVR